MTNFDPAEISQRRADIADAVTAKTKELLTRRTTTLRRRAETAEDERDEMRRNYEGACKTVAAMHKAAVGEVRGPNRGVVEDVADVRERAERAEAAIERVRAIKKSPKRSPWNTYTNAQDDGWDEALGAVLAALDERRPALAKPVDAVPPAPGTAPANEKYRFATTWAEYAEGKRAALAKRIQEQ